MKNCRDYDLKRNYQGNYIKSSSNTKFFGLIIDDSLLWKAHINQMMSKMNTACFVIRMTQAIMFPKTLRMVYFAYVHSITSYGIIFWETNHIVRRFSKFKRELSELLQIQERETHVGNWKYCPYTQYIFSLPIFVIKNKHLFYKNNQIHSVHTRFNTNLHPPTANLTKFQKGVYYSGIKIFNNLPHNIKHLANQITLFWNALKRFLLIHYFYNSEEYFNCQR